MMTITKPTPEQTLLFELTLAFYTNAYIKHHAKEWDTPEKFKAATDPEYIRKRWIAHVGTERWDEYLGYAEAAVNLLRGRPDLIRIFALNLVL